MRSHWFRAEILVFLLLLGSYAFFWHSRDWNTASRLILTYAMVDRGTVCLDGLDGQTGDIAFYQGHYYCDKLPGFSLVAAAPYALARWVFRFPAHPLKARAIDYWPADYWVTLATSGVFTALTAILLMNLACDLGCPPRRAALVGVSYGLATPAYVYATLAYGHQLSAFALLMSFLLLYRRNTGRGRIRMVAAGFLAAYAAVIELQIGPVSAILGLYLLVQVLRRERSFDALGYFTIGAAVPTMILIAYNTLAFGSPLVFGYFHHATAQFARVHSRSNPLGLIIPDVRLIVPLLWGEHRGLLFYAPILMLAVPGWLALAARRQFALAIVSLASAGAIFVVNLSYPEWTGGWSTGPRLLVPLLPFVMIPVAATLSGHVHWSVIAFCLSLAVAGGILIFLFQGVGARIPQDVHSPLRDLVWPLWTGRSALPIWWTGQRFSATVMNVLGSDWEPRLRVIRQARQYVPLVICQLIAIVAIFRITGDRSREPRARGLDLGIDQQEQSRGADQDAQNPEAQPRRVDPDAGP